jgi:hypothetical protein
VLIFRPDPDGTAASITIGDPGGLEEAIRSLEAR